jgi:hypothetical protein
MIQDGTQLWLLTPAEYDQLPAGTVLTSIAGSTHVKGVDKIDMDVRFGHLAYGVLDPASHKEAELFTKFKLS